MKQACVRCLVCLLCLLCLSATVALVLLPADAEARKRCRPVAPEAAEASAEAEARWPHDVDHGWVHAADSRWVHEGAARDSVDHGWVHDVDHGWWAALPGVDVGAEVEIGAETEIGAEAEIGAGAGLNDLDEDELAGEQALLEDCTVDKRRNECAVLGNQVATYRFRLGLALQREDELWAESLVQTIDRLETRGARFTCPWVEPTLRQQIEQTVEAVAEALGVAAQVAALLYRMGLF